MDLRQLNALLAVADQGSFTAAADTLDTVQSNVSAHIARLEREVGAVLVDRSTGQLTEEGGAVAARARRVSVELEAVNGDVAAGGDVVPRRARRGRPHPGDHPHASGRARRGPAHRLAHLPRARAADPPADGRPRVPPARRAPGTGVRHPPATHRRGPAEPGPA